MRAVLLIFTAAALWAMTGVIVGLGLSAYFGGDWVIECGTLNLAIGMILLQLITRSEAGRRLFYEGIREEDQLHLGNGASRRAVVAGWQALSAVAVVGVHRAK